MTGWSLDSSDERRRVFDFLLQKPFDGHQVRHIIGQALNINEHVKGGGKEYGANPMDEVMGGDDDDDDDDDDDELRDDDDDDDEGLGCDKVYNLRHS